MGRRHPDTDTKAQALIYAEVYGDEAACKRFKLSARSLRRYRELAREPDSELSETVRRYAGAIQPEVKAEDFLSWLQGQVQAAAGLLVKHAGEANPNNPETLRVLNEHVETLLSHALGLDYLSRRFDAHDEPDDGAHTDARADGPPVFGSGTCDGRPATA